MKRGMLITLLQHEDVTEYLTTFSRSIINECKKRNFRFKSLKKEKANKNEFESSPEYNFVVLNGHGSENCITGHKNREIVTKGKNEAILFDRIVYARSCWAGAGLGKCYEFKSNKGCFIGYNIPFMFLIDTTWATNPSKDKTAEIFFKTSNNVAIGLIKGRTAKEANENSKKSMLKAIKKSLIKNEDNSRAIAEILWNNYSGQIIFGNKESKI